MRIRTVLGFGTLLGAVAIGIATAIPTTPLNIHIEGTSRSIELAELRRRADIIAIVTPTGSSNVHWNSTDGRRWGNDSSDLVAFIYRDDSFRVLVDIAGAAPDELTIRGIGGVADGVHMSFEGQVDWEVGTSYLVFLDHLQTPTEGGEQKAIVVVGWDHGVFSQSDDGTWVNAYGLVATVGDLSPAL